MFQCPTRFVLASLICSNNSFISLLFLSYAHLLTWFSPGPLVTALRQPCNVSFKRPNNKVVLVNNKESFPRQIDEMRSIEEAFKTVAMVSNSEMSPISLVICCSPFSAR
ncbi:uncharacterized protein CC84DRAFT_240 [Paraphaeosphaeria sporulosa]|uniref:Uncharacterized protein n=1 Tax=Paraphaeosphaeria sporulosa TaxID=1460663 RepID=A0A177CWA5_9PLEO|nr:uncharacterized protein CC84DRAFT_240 [Paraphaeosphaeria sporulosa]OAG11150.1 hypothetical protein CC84DRAFT_240 [Paraphaeosphaeria sporulosa]